RVCVALPADAGDPRWMSLGLDVLRSLEHHVLDQVREAGSTGLLILRAHVIPDFGMHDRRRVILEQDHLHTIAERRHCVIETRRPGGGTCGRIQRRRGERRQHQHGQQTKRGMWHGVVWKLSSLDYGTGARSGWLLEPGFE